MIQVILLLEDNTVSELLREPCNVFWGRQLVNITGEKHCRQGVVLERHKGGILGSIDFEILLRTVVVHGEVASVDGLGVVDHRTVSLT